LSEFCNALHFNFGKAGTTIETTIAKRYYSRLEKKFTDYPGYGLVDYVEKASSKQAQPTVDVQIMTTTVTMFTFTGQPNNS
jgi:GTP-binding protein EngB required for normal cell division